MSDDFYKYPDNHVGRKVYVPLQGYDRLVPKYKTYKGQDRLYHLLPEYGGTFGAYGNPSAYLMPDKEPYKSPIDGTVVTGRMQHREHMKIHDVIEVGDEPMGRFKDNDTPVTAREIADTIRELEGR